MGSTLEAKDLISLTKELALSLGRELSLVMLSILVGVFVAALANRVQALFLVSMFIGALAGGIFSMIASSLLSKRWPSPELALNSSIIKFHRSSLSFALVFALLLALPMNLDRSFSVWTLNEIHNRTTEAGQPLDIDHLSAVMAEFFGPDSDELSRRLSEQELLGNMRAYEGSVDLTTQGKMLREVFRVVALFFNLNPRYTQ